MSQQSLPILTGNPRTDRALLNVARILAEIARNPKPDEQDDDRLQPMPQQMCAAAPE